MSLKKWTCFAAVALTLGAGLAACAKKEMPAKDRASKKEKPEKSGTLRVTGESVALPKEFKSALSVLTKADEGFQKFWSRYWKTDDRVISPFADVLEKMTAHQDKDLLKIEREGCPDFKSQLDILLRIRKEKRAVSVIHLKTTTNCAETEIDPAATFEFKDDKILITMHAQKLAKGFGQTLSAAKTHASCSAKIAKSGELESLKCSGLGQDHGDGKALQLTNFEFIPASGLINAQGSTIDAANFKPCAGESCIDFTTLAPKEAAAQ